MSDSYFRNYGWLNAADFGASGSDYTAACHIENGSRVITVENTGDFKAGQGVMVKGAHIDCGNITLWGPYGTVDSYIPFNNEISFRGYDGSNGSWVVYMIDMPKDSVGVLRWSDDLGRVWHENVSYTYEDWIPLTGGAEVRINPYSWEKGYTAVVSCRDQLKTRIEKIEGNKVTLSDAANRTTEGLLIHNDLAALQSGIDEAIKTGKRLFVPNGHYKISETLKIVDAEGFTLEGESAPGTVLDISEGTGSCIQLRNGTEVNVRNFSMVGGMGFEERDQAGFINTKGASEMWGIVFKGTCAVGIFNTERVLLENCRARHMSSECFFSAGQSRSLESTPGHYTKEITYLNCAVEDCARNAFNNCDQAENTRMINCRICDVGGCAWEGASRFVRMTGCYVRNAGTVAMGNIRSRSESFERLGSGQHVITGNTFESVCPYGGFMLRAGAGGTQVIIRDNHFINFNSSAIDISGDNGSDFLPASNVIISGNIMDMTAEEGEPVSRTAIQISANDVTVSDNQIYVRGKTDPTLTGISVRDDALRANIHDNTVVGCGNGIISTYTDAWVGEKTDSKSFKRKQGFYEASPSLPGRRSHLYKGWKILWLDDSTESEIEIFDPETCIFHLKEETALADGRPFRLYRPGGAYWQIHSNIATGCDTPMNLGTYSANGAIIRDNIV